MRKNSLWVVAQLTVVVTIIFAVATGQEAGGSVRTAQPSGTSLPRPSSKSDAEIQSCIQGRLASSEKLRSQEFVVSVSKSEATFTGNARNAGSKGAATRIAQSCGAVKIVNNITAPAIPRPPKKVEGRTSL